MRGILRKWYRYVLDVEVGLARMNSMRTMRLSHQASGFLKLAVYVELCVRTSAYVCIPFEGPDTRDTVIGKVEIVE